MIHNRQRVRTAFALVGRPSCAKGTAVKHVFEAFCRIAGIELVVVPVSRHLKGYVDNLDDRDLAKSIDADMNAGRLVHDNITNAVFDVAVAESAKRFQDYKKPLMVILDGAPRTIGQVNPSIFSVTSRFNVPVSSIDIVHVSTPSLVCAYRMGIRGRTDDSEGVLLTRFQEYEEKTAPAISLMRSLTKDSGSAFHKISGQTMKDSATIYQKQLFGNLWPEFFPDIVRA